MRFSPFPCALAALLCFCTATSVAVAQNAPAPVVGAATAAPLLRTLDLNRETTLRAPISFEVRQRALADVLADLQKQSGVALSARDETAIAAFKVTAHVEAMPLWQVLQSLARLYGFVWQKNGQGYAIAMPENAALDRLLLQLGAPDSIDEQAHLQSWRERRGIDWLGQVTPFASEADLRAMGGVALSALTPELQTRLRHPIELPAAARLVQKYAQAAPQTLEPDVLRISVRAPGKNALGAVTPVPATTINLIDAAGKSVASIIRVEPEAPTAP